jgi:hypothetical protein
MKTILLSIVPILSAIAFMSSAEGAALYQHKEPTIPQRERTRVQTMPNNIQRIRPEYGTTTPTEINRTSPLLNQSNFDCNPDWGTCPLDGDGNPVTGTGPNPCHGPYCPPRIP